IVWLISKHMTDLPPNCTYDFDPIRTYIYFLTLHDALPIFLWLVKKDSVINMDKHGKAILNFQISIFLYALISVPLIFLFGFGLIALFAIVIMSLILPIVNAVNSSNGKAPYYPFSLHIIN